MGWSAHEDMQRRVRCRQPLLWE